MILSPDSAASTETHEPSHPPLASLVFLAGTIDLKQDKLERATTVAHQAQLRAQLAQLRTNFQQQYLQWLQRAGATPEASQNLAGGVSRRNEVTKKAPLRQGW